MPKIASRQHLTTVAGLPGFWSTCAGGETSVTHTKVRDGGSLNPEILSAPPEIGDVTVKRPYDTLRDKPIETRLRKLLASGGRLVTIVTKQTTDGDYTPDGSDPTVWEVELMRVHGPDGDANSNNPTEIELVFTARSAR